MSRSQNYPGIGLPIAVELVEKVWKAKEHATMTVEETVKAIGFGALSGPARVALSALKKYGFLAKHGHGLQLSDRGLTIAIEKESPSYQEAIRAAFNDIELFREVEQAIPNGSEELLKRHLIRERGFTATGAKNFVKAFLASKTLAIPNGSATLSGGIETTKKLHPPPPPPPRSTQMTAEPTEFAASITLVGDGDFRLIAPGHISDVNKVLIETWLKAVISSLTANQQSPETGSAQAGQA